MNRAFTVLTAMALAAIGVLAGTSIAADRIDFNRDIQPILADKCFHCHGPDASQRKAKLRLDTHEGALLVNGDGVAAIVPGSLQKSDLIRRITSTDPDVQMPPPKSGRQLSRPQIDVLGKWVEQGAPWAKHWSFVAPVRPQLPVVREITWVRNPIDAFILSRLEAEGLHPSPVASKEKLIRRVTLDLTGLPPTPAEIDAFLTDSSPDAYEKVVDRLLSSVRYGERMALPWLDAARYADTNGYQADGTRTSWIWRDWLVKSLNDNMPFDEFTVDQIAGDLVPDSSQPKKIATSFCRMHMLNGEGGSIPEESRNNYIIDRVNTVSTVFLGLTLGCCQCHDHKYDPFTQKDYYQLFAYFNSVPESGSVDAAGNAKPVMKVLNAKDEDELPVLKQAVADADAALKKAMPKIDAAQIEWEKASAGAASPSWTIVAPSSMSSKNGAKMNLLEDGSVLVSGKSPDVDVQEVVLKSDLHEIAGLRLEVLPDDSLPHGGPGRSEDAGNFILTELEAEVSPLANAKKTEKVVFSAAEATYSQTAYAVVNAITKQPPQPKGRTPDPLGWAVAKAPNKNNLVATFTFADPITIAGGAQIRLKFHYDSAAHKQHTMGHFRLALAAGSFLPPGISSALNSPGARRSAADKKKLTDYYRNTVSRDYRRLYAESVMAKDNLTGFESSLTPVMVMEEMPTPRETFVHVRGQYDKPGDRVYPNIPATLPPLPAGAPANRLALAKWLVAPENPLTARVAVNRFWQTFFGTGLVKTTEDFGIQGEKPSHPELLDWLATEFVSSKWNVKAMHRMIVTSAVYRQSSRVSPELIEKDPDNRLLARGARYRLSAFSLRDQALAVSGLLVDTVGGLPVKPYQPAGMWEEFSFNKIKYTQDHGDALYRRSLYTFWRRTVPPPTMFDTSSRQICTVRQGRTNTPLQSLVLLNEMTYVECSRIMAERLLKDVSLKTDADRLAFGFRLCTARNPSESEIHVLVGSLERLHKQFDADKDSATKLLSVGEKPRYEKLDPSQLAAYAQVCDLLLNLDETLTKE